MKLALLDSCTLDSILSFKDIDVTSLRLWLTGDKLLQRKIASRLSVVSLYNDNEFSTRGGQDAAELEEIQERLVKQSGQSATEVLMAEKLQKRERKKKKKEERKLEI